MDSKSTSKGAPVKLEYFSDVLCVWAYGSQIRVDELRREFAALVELRYRFIPLFAATHQRVGEGWRDRGGFAGFGRHTLEVASRWEHVRVHAQVWQRDVPPSSTGAHLFLKAIQLLEDRGAIAAGAQADLDGRSLFEEAAWQIRLAFFRDALNIAERTVLDGVAERLSLPLMEIWSLIDSGEAHAALHLDLEAKERYQVPGSPTFVMDEGRQRLYGNVGYRIIEANVRELLHNPQYGEASWC